MTSVDRGTKTSERASEQVGGWVGELSEWVE